MSKMIPFKMWLVVLIGALGMMAAQAAEPPAAKGPPAGFVAPDEPKANDTAAQRNISQPLNNAPVWKAVRESGVQAGTVNLPAAEAGVLIQKFVQYPGSTYTTAGEAWRQVRNQWIIPYGGALVFIVVVALALFYKTKGPLGGHLPETGRMIERFTPLERAAHGVNALAFVVLGISGLVMAFGKFILLPFLGATLFGWLTYLLKNMHNFAGPLFAVSLVIVFVTFVRDNFFTKHDLAWLKQGVGLLRGQEVPSHRFNAGEKVVFWGGVFVLGLVVVASGLVLDKVLPGLAYFRGDMQVAHIIHSTAAILMLCMFLGHIYLGTIGTRGAFKGMRTGYVDEAWAQEHHALWLEDVRAGKIPAQRSSPTSPVAANATSQP